MGTLNTAVSSYVGSTHCNLTCNSYSWSGAEGVGVLTSAMVALVAIAARLFQQMDVRRRADSNR
jgi:hypothetical protein